MRAYLGLLVLLTTAFTSFGQTEKHVPSIQIVGQARTSVKPDVGVLIISITNKSLEASQAISGLNDKTKDVSKQLMSIGFKENDIKTTDFQVRENKIYRREEIIDSGYVAMQNVKVEFKGHKENIAKILTAFSKSKTDFTVNFDFKLSDELQEKVKNELIKSAIKDANSKSKVIAESAGVKLLRIRDINYGGGGIIMNESGARYKLAAASDSMEGFTPTDMEFSDTVVITWQLE